MIEETEEMAEYKYSFDHAFFLRFQDLLNFFNLHQEIQKPKDLSRLTHRILNLHTQYRAPYQIITMHFSLTYFYLDFT